MYSKQIPYKPNKKSAFSAFISVLTIILVLAILSACQSQPAEQPAGNPPSVELKVLNAAQAGLGRAIEIQTMAQGGEGIVRVELLVNGAVVRIDANPTPQPNTPYLVVQPWSPAENGTYTIQSKAYNTANIAGESPPLTLTIPIPSAQVAKDVASNEAESATPTLKPTATLTPTLEPSPVPLETPTPIPTATEPSPNPTETATVEPTPIPLPSATPTLPIFQDTGLRPEGRFLRIWEELGAAKSRLGFPLNPVIEERNYAYQNFGGGMLFWWDNPDDPDFIWAINMGDVYEQGQGWVQYEDNWAGDSEFSCEQARNNGEFGPRRGFGLVWCQNAALQQQFGPPTRAEFGSSGNPPFSRVQFFQGGTMVLNPATGQVVVLFNQGDWLRMRN